MYSYTKPNIFKNAQEVTNMPPSMNDHPDWYAIYPLSEWLCLSYVLVLFVYFIRIVNCSSVRLTAFLVTFVIGLLEAAYMYGGNKVGKLRLRERLLDLIHFQGKGALWRVWPWIGTERCSPAVNDRKSSGHRPLE